MCADCCVCCIDGTCGCCAAAGQSCADCLNFVCDGCNSSNPSRGGPRSFDVDIIRDGLLANSGVIPSVQNDLPSQLDAQRAPNPNVELDVQLQDDEEEIDDAEDSVPFATTQPSDPERARENAAIVVEFLERKPEEDLIRALYGHAALLTMMHLPRNRWVDVKMYDDDEDLKKRIREVFDEAELLQLQTLVIDLNMDDDLTNTNWLAARTALADERLGVQIFRVVFMRETIAIDDRLEIYSDFNKLEYFLDNGEQPYVSNHIF